MNTRARPAAPGGVRKHTNTKAEVVAGKKGRKANYGVGRSAPRRASTWVAMSERAPEFGQLVAINFIENWTRLELCYFDNQHTWERREHDELGFDIRDDYLPGWFTLMSDKGDWWEASVVAYWSPILPPPTNGPSTIRE